MKKILIILGFFFSIAANAQITLSWPADRAVFQRNNSGNASILIAGQAPPVAWQAGWQLQYEIKYLTKAGADDYNHTSWTAISNPGLGKVFRVTKTMPTGWFRLNVRLMDGGTQIASASVKFGVGEVFIVAGQSNALGEQNTADQNSDTYDCVISSFQTASNQCSSKLPVYPVLSSLGYTSASKISPNGTLPWAYKMLGKRIADNSGGGVVPSLFFNTAMSGSEVSQWSNSADNSSGYYDVDPWSVDRCNFGNGGLGEPYRTLRNSLNFYGSLFGVRGILWHQGESDTKQTTSSGDYATRLDTVISKTRSHFNSNLAWAIGNVSLICDGCSTSGPDQTSSNVLSGQASSRASYSGVLLTDSSDYFSNSNSIVTPNPYSGTYTTYRVNGSPNRTHFSNSGLWALAQNYYPKITNSSTGLYSKTPVSANNAIVPVTISQVGSNKKIEIDFTSMGKSSTDFQCYQWTTGDDYTNATYPPSNCAAYSAKTVTSNGSWRCYMQDKNNGNVYMTQKLVINTDPNVRVAQSDFNSKVYPNPSFSGFENTIEFEVAETSRVKLELINGDGNILKTLADGVHESGLYKYPFALRSQIIKEIETFYYRLTINESSITRRIIIE